MEDEYKIVQNDKHLTAYKNGSVLSHCLKEEFALHSIWVDAGSNENHYFHVDEDGNVYRETKTKNIQGHSDVEN